LPLQDIIQGLENFYPPLLRSTMDRELIDRAEAIQQRILQLRDSL